MGTLGRNSKGEGTERAAGACRRWRGREERMRVVSVNVGMPQEIMVDGRPVLTGIFKSPVDGRTALRTLNLDGDRQTDLRVHGGRDKAVYAYPIEHYPVWRARLGLSDLPPGSFGENL